MDEFLINTSTSGDQGQPAVAGFRGTQFVVVWEDRGSGNIRGQMLGVNGAKTGSEFLVNFPGEPGTRRQLPAVVECGLGFAVAWTEQVPGAQPQLKLRTFDQDTLSGPESQVSSAEVEPLITAGHGASDGWRLRRRLGRQAAGRAYPCAAFCIRGNEKRPRVSRQYHRRAASRSHGGLPGERKYRDRVACAPARTPSRSFADFRRERTGGRRADDEPGHHGGGHDGARFRRFVIAHIRSAFDGEPGFETTITQASVFEASGAFANIRFAATAVPRIQSSWPTLAPLPGGRFLLAWTEVNVDNVAAGINVKARIFSPAQGAIGQVTQFNTSAGSQRFSLSAATTSGPEGEIAFAAWTDDRQSGGDPSGRAVRGRPLSIPPGGF